MSNMPKMINKIKMSAAMRKVDGQRLNAMRTNTLLAVDSHCNSFLMLQAALLNKLQERSDEVCSTGYCQD